MVEALTRAVRLRPYFVAAAAWISCQWHDDPGAEPRFDGVQSPTRG
jgi:hypothetical protein